MNLLKKVVKAVAARTPVARDLLRLRTLTLQYEKEILQYRRQLNLIGDVCETYATYSDAVKDLVSEEGYDNSELADYIATKTKTWLAQAQTSPWHLGSDVLQSLFVALLVSNRVGSLRVLDLGGGCAIPPAILRTLVGREFPFSWNVVELPTLVNAVGSVGLDHAKWTSSTASAMADLGGVDLIHTSGTLQCLHNPREVLAQLLSLNVGHVFFGRVAFNAGGEDVIGIQRSPVRDHGVQVPGDITQGYVEYPFTYMPLDDFERILAEAGYELVLDFAESSGMRPINDFKIVGGGACTGSGKSSDPTKTRIVGCRGCWSCCAVEGSHDQTKLLHSVRQ